MSFRHVVNVKRSEEEAALQKLEFKDKYDSVEDCIKDIKSKGDAFKAFKCVGIARIKENDISGISSKLNDFIVTTKSRKEPKFKELRKSLKKIIEMLDKAVRESGDVDDNLRIAFSVLAYYRSKKNVDKYLEGDSDISKSSQRVEKLKVRLNKFKDHLEIAYKLANKSADKKTKDKAIGINDMIKAADEIIKSLNEGFTEVTIAKITELGKVLTSGESAARAGVRGMCDFVRLLVRRASLNTAEGKQIFNLCKQFDGCKHVLKAVEGRGAFNNDGANPADRSDAARRQGKILYAAQNCARLSGILRKIREQFASLFVGHTSGLIESFDNVIERLETCYVNDANETLNNLIKLDTDYDRLSEKLEEDGGGLTGTVLEAFGVIRSSLKDCLSKLK